MAEMNKNTDPREMAIYENPFEDISFWLTLATTDFSFGLFKNYKKSEPEKGTNNA